MATPRFNTRNREGVRIVTQNANFASIFELGTKASAAYQFEVKITAFTQGPGNAAPAAYAYWRRALFVTSATGVVTQVGPTQTPAADLESAAGADIAINIVGTSIVCTASASYPTNWVSDAWIGQVDLINEA